MEKGLEKCGKRVVNELLSTKPKPFPHTTFKLKTFEELRAG